MASRLELEEYFKTLTKNVYYQPPVNTKMSYPAIRYSREDIGNTHADNLIYKQDLAYKVVVIDANPDSPIVTAVSKIPTCRFINHVTAEGLNNDTFILYW